MEVSQPQANDAVELEPYVQPEKVLQIIERTMYLFVQSIADGKRVTLLGRDMGINPKGVVRLLAILTHVQSLLLSGRSISQRDLYYELVGLFPAGQADCNRELAFLQRQLSLSRLSLNIYASSRGQVCGKLQIRTPAGDWIDCATLGRDGKSISGDLGDSAAPLRTDARWIIVVEKEGIYHELSDAKVYNQLPCIIISAHGFPDLATRAFVSRLSSEFGLPVLGVCDFNPGGLGVLLTYRSGAYTSNPRKTGEAGSRATKRVSGGAGSIEGSLYTCPGLLWLGLLWEDIESQELTQRVPLTASDVHKLSTFESTEGLLSTSATLQVRKMQNAGVRVELQALREKTTLPNWLWAKVLQKKWVEL